ncbi:MAG: tryptophan--tRNA ligase [Crenarchaeota archaeon]|nr:tryptophan--tRNA ligase [Thermoproteota archaeon]
MVAQDQTFTVTPWEVKGRVDYRKLAEQFGVKLLTEDDIRKIEKLAGDSHHLLRRGFFYAHRGLETIIERIEKGQRWALYTGRGPSADLHLGHILPWMFTKWLCDRFNVELFFEMTDDEKFLVRDLPLEVANRYAYDNALTLIALGFRPEQLHLIIDTEDIHYLYRIAVKVAKCLTLSTVKHTFGFTDSTNVGAAFFPTLQISVAFLPTELYREEAPVLIPAGIDQDPYFRLARDIADRLNYPKPCTLYCKFVPALTGEEKMSASRPETAIYINDDDETVRRKIMNAFTGGQPTKELQRKLGGNPDICVVYRYFMAYVPDDNLVRKIYEDCRSGKLICGECKKMLYEHIVRFLHELREKREKARDIIHKYRISSKF